MHVAHACSQFSEHSRSLHRRTHMCVYISRCGRFSANRQLSCKSPVVSWEFIEDLRFLGCSPVGGFKGDFQEPRISNVPVGTISARTPDSRKLPRRIRENRHEPGNPDSSPASSTRHRPNPSLPCLHRHRQPHQHQQTPPPTPTVIPASANASDDADGYPSIRADASADTDSRLSVGRRFWRAYKGKGETAASQS